MAKKIIELVRAKRDEIHGRDDLAEELATMAVAAINDGIKSRAWEKFMFEFVEKDPNDNTKPLDPAQLARLLAEDGSLGNRERDRARGYLLSNAMCGAGSPDTANLDSFVNSIDDGLAGGCEVPLNAVANSSVKSSGESATPAVNGQSSTTAESLKPDAALATAQAATTAESPKADAAPAATT
jgi:hypothetical protein